MNTQPTLAALAFAAVLASASHAQTTLVSDSFDSVSLNGSGTAQTLVSGAYTYYQHANSALYSSSTNGALSFAGTNNSQGRISFSTVTLANVNDYITVSFNVTYAAGATSQTSGLRFGLYNTLGDINTAYGTNGGANTIGDTAQGYYAATNPGGTGAAWSAGSNNLSKDLGNGATTTQYSSINGGNGVMNVAGQSFASAVTFGSVTQSVSLTLTKTAAGILVSANVAGESFSATDTGANGSGNNGIVYTTYDTFFFGNGTASGAWTMDNLVITTNAGMIPEPSATAALLGGLALVGACVLRRGASVR